MQSVAPYLATVCLGAMLFFSFVLAPLIFVKLPAEQAGRLIRAVFPRYYAVLGGVASVAAAAALYSDTPGALVMLLVVFGFGFSRFILVPAINAARDRELDGDKGAAKKFKKLHRVSVMINMGQILLLGYVSSRLIT